MRVVTEHFRRELLPSARAFYERELGRLSRPDRKGWCRANCPFHRSQSGTSLSVQLATGAFHCFGCGVHGWDTVQFTRLRYHLSFQEAAIRLGAWDKAPTPETIRRLAAEARERERQKEASERQRVEQRERLLLLRDNLHVALRLEREATDQLDETHQAGGDEEPLWQLLAALVDYVRWCDDEYCRAAGLEFAG